MEHCTIYKNKQIGLNSELLGHIVKFNGKKYLKFIYPITRGTSHGALSKENM